MNTVTSQKEKDSQDSGLEKVNLHQRKQIFTRFEHLGQSFVSKFENISCKDEICIQFRSYYSAAKLHKSYFMEGIQKLEYRWTKCINLKGKK